MSLRTRHGTAANHGVGPVVETPPADELGPGRQVATLASAGEERDAGGRFRKGARTAQASGGRATRHKAALATRLGLGQIMALPEFAPYLGAARDFARVHRAYLREKVAGGESSPAVAAVVTNAAWQRAAADFLFAQAASLGDPELFVRASKIANDARQALLTAHHLAELAGKAAPKGPPPIWIPPAPPTNDAEDAAPASAEASDEAVEDDARPAGEERLS